MSDVNEYDLLRKWFPDALDAARARRMKYSNGSFVNCRHYEKINGQRNFICKRKNTEKRNCTGCTTCPNCDGRLGFDKRQTRYNRDGIYYRESYICVHCGAYIEHEFYVAKQRQPEVEELRAGKCQVHGCTCMAWEGHAHKAGRKWIICETHFRRMKTWAHTIKDPSRKPLITENGKLIDNPDYRKKQKQK